MEKLKEHKEIIVLLLIIIYLYVVMTIGGCAAKPMGSRDILNSDYSMALVCEDFKGEPYLEIAKKGMMDAGEILSMHPSIITLNANNDTVYTNKAMNKAALDNSVVIVVGGWLRNAMKVSARELRDQNFAIIDGELDEANVKSIIYKNEEGAFLMGIIAGGETKSNKVGFIGGLNDEEGNKFLSGYVSGVKMMNNKAYSSLVDYSQIRFTEDFKDENKAYEKAKTLYQNGCDIIFHTCGSAGKGVFKAAKDMNKKAIGVDVDCAKVFPEYKEEIISSLIKNLDKKILEIAEEIKTGSFKCGIGNIEKLGIKEGAFMWSEGTKNNVSKNTYENLVKYNELIKQEILDIPSEMFKVVSFKGDKNQNF